MITEVKDRLWTRNYLFVCIAAFMMSFSFFILVPTLPLYLKDTFGISQAMVGVVLSCYVVAVLSVRPMAGFVADTFRVRVSTSLPTQYSSLRSSDISL